MLPGRENLDFGAGDEAHAIYNFPLPPLICSAICRETGRICGAGMRHHAARADGLRVSELVYPPATTGSGCALSEGLLAEDESNSIDTVLQVGGWCRCAACRRGKARTRLNTTL